MKKGRGQTINKSPTMTGLDLTIHATARRSHSVRNTKNAQADNGRGVTSAGGESGLPLRPTSSQTLPEEMQDPVNWPSFYDLAPERNDV